MTSWAPGADLGQPKKSPQAERILLFVCLGPTSFCFTKRNTEWNCRYLNTQWHNYDQMRRYNLQWRKKELTDIDCLIGFSLSFYLLSTFLCSVITPEPRPTFLDITIETFQGVICEWRDFREALVPKQSGVACSETTGEQTPNKQAPATNSNQLETADALLSKWWSRAANTF